MTGGLSATDLTSHTEVYFIYSAEVRVELIVAPGDPTTVHVGVTLETFVRGPSGFHVCDVAYLMHCLAATQQGAYFVVTEGCA